ncbi:putative glutamine amidotransferase [Desulfitobacterium dichloroeliminans LMG P-21439]|uniref:Lipid II isoglutaminyl synthase (glutamine-hydrolyzing) subunit GatD n=1 Tax=Desulfitobacterium dichloroeliminans (strain LMG P-21439 / DCA1) TaxID=871963 RepID=L0F6L5_DESDL|nr:glutamine amidotransferase [Desulfitobacterium dichloroeliminans]AGA68583.1 putative glutamine amidotransferase [Desulfitobacterium dichloroeliminans LMG P-21439]
MKIKLCHLYPDLLDLYGDRGNIMALSARAHWRGLDLEVQRVSLGEKIDFQSLDILFIGGGSDREQNILVQDLMERVDDFKAAVEDGLVVLTICGGYQLLGKYYQTAEGNKIPGLGVLDLWTVAGTNRLIGNIVVDLDIEDLTAESERARLSTMVGFENHSGRTYLGTHLKPLGKVIHGHGNNGEDSGEGMRYKNVFGTYLHGPLLPKNPHLADLLLRLAMERRGLTEPLSLLDDELEELAHQTVVQRILSKM